MAWDEEVTLSHHLQDMHTWVHQPGSWASPFLNQGYLHHIGSPPRKLWGQMFCVSPALLSAGWGTSESIFLICKMKSRTRKHGVRGWATIWARITLLPGISPQLVVHTVDSEGLKIKLKNIVLSIYWGRHCVKPCGAGLAAHSPAQKPSGGQVQFRTEPTQSGFRPSSPASYVTLCKD